MNYSNIIDAATIAPSFLSFGISAGTSIKYRYYAGVSFLLSILIIIPALITIMLAILDNWVSFIFLAITFIIIIFSYAYVALLIERFLRAEEAVNQILRKK